MTTHSQFNRRQFQSTLLASGVVAWTGTQAIGNIARSRGRKRRSPNDRINVGFIGVGKMGLGHLNRFVGYDDVQVVGVCDVVQERIDNAQQTVNRRYADAANRADYHGCDAYGDFRTLLDRDDVDAVVISTPDHWHAIPCILAAKAGKDIYCEKPLTHNILEGRKLVDAVHENDIVFQTGSQQRSEFGGKFRLAAELVRNGRLGKIHTVRIGVGGPAVWCDLPDEETPVGTDWDSWVGPAPMRDFNEILCPKGVHNHFPAWRRYREYAGGGLADMGAHHFDIAQWALGQDESGPVRIDPPEDRGNSNLKLTYADGIEMYHGGPSGCTFEGELGTLYVDRGKIESNPASILEEPITDDDERVYFSDHHHRNWVDCIKERQDPICNAEIGHRSASICHLANIGYWLQRPLQWDPESESFTDDAEANQLRWREPREPWNII